MEELIWIIIVSVAGGIILLALMAFIIYKCCCKSRRRNNDGNANGQNGHTWQAHDKDVELADEEEPREKLKKDGLCEETEAGWTFPRRAKAEDQNPEPKTEDGLREDTEMGFAYPRRGRTENELLLPTDTNNLSASETALKSVVPIGFMPITSSGGKEGRNERTKTDVQDHRAEHENSKEKVKDKESSSDSTSDSDNDEEHQNGAQHLIKTPDKKGRRGNRKRSFVQKKRSNSLHYSLEEIPEYSKPIKRSVSNPSIAARERMVQKDKRFESFETWRSTIPIPEPDHQNDFASKRSNEEDDQDNAPPSYATSDSGVECLDALSGHDDESINQSDSVPESPGIPSQLKDETSFSSFKETTSYRERTEMRYQESKPIMHTTDQGMNGFQSNALVMTTKDHTALIDVNAVKDSSFPFATTNQQGIFFQSTPTEDKSKDIALPYSDPKLALKSVTSPVSNSMSSSRQKTNEKIQTKEEQMDFRSVKLRPTSTNYEQSTNTFTILGSNHGYTAATPSSENKKEHPTSLEQQRPKNQDIASPWHSGQSMIINTTDGPKDHYVLGFSKNQANDAERNVIQISNPETENRTDFHRVHLRQTPQSLKQHIAFREEMEQRESTDTQTREDNSNSDETEKESETVIGVHDGIKRFQSQAAQVPKPVYGSHYISKKDPNQKPVNIVSKEPVPKMKPVDKPISIVAPEPPTMDREQHKTFIISSSNTDAVKANQKENIPITISKNERTRPMSMNESVVSEDRRHIRYSTGNFNQSHVTLGFKDLPPKSMMVIRGLDEEEKKNTTSGKQDSQEKPVAVVPPQSPKSRTETPEDRAAFEEERKKNWKREQIEQKLTTAHLRSQAQNQQLMQASGLAYRQCMPELFSKIKQIGEEKDEVPVE
ncbi:uncharacterized protein LOC116300326 [Actinia tenebrosa]|uniref:Uncharacterized protein LOC116300326 n=1 Tax=Actinia tenebrosa TaxID=6105 RepID=A0A6P8IC49_ACTTE|nr:uncharacterized protein LOC116300326 [Actinia tenebrosa]